MRPHLQARGHRRELPLRMRPPCAESAQCELGVDDDVWIGSAPNARRRYESRDGADSGCSAEQRSAENERSRGRRRHGSNVGGRLGKCRSGGPSAEQLRSAVHEPWRLHGILQLLRPGRKVRGGRTRQACGADSIALQATRPQKGEAVLIGAPGSSECCRLGILVYPVFPSQPLLPFLERIPSRLYARLATLFSALNPHSLASERTDHAGQTTTLCIVAAADSNGAGRGGSGS